MYICIYVDMYICIYICIYVYMYICIYVFMYVCIYVYMYICLYVSCVYMYHAYVYFDMYAHDQWWATDISRSTEKARMKGYTKCSTGLPRRWLCWTLNPGLALGIVKCWPGSRMWGRRLWSAPPPSFPPAGLWATCHSLRQLSGPGTGAPHGVTWPTRVHRG